MDELNLAPTEVLEALNRLLDDNRELFISETLETVKPHPSFMLFATQNPAGVYGGRKQLSQALRNRFIELHVDDIPGNEIPVHALAAIALAATVAKTSAMSLLVKHLFIDIELCTLFVLDL